MKKHVKLLLFLLIGASVSGCSMLDILVKHEYQETSNVNKETYLKNKNIKGIVLVSSSGMRDWGCGTYNNVELRSIGFDLEPSNKARSTPPDVVINDTPNYSKNHVFLLKPGTYSLSYIRLKLAKSVSEIFHKEAKRATLIKGSKSAGGSFTVKAGEAVYIGHFIARCNPDPTLRRFYLKDRKYFVDYVNEIKAEYPYLNLDNVQYRLFSTKVFGNDYSLP